MSTAPLTEREVLTALQSKVGRAMTRLNKIRVVGVRQQDLLAQTQDLVSDALDLLQAREDELDDQAGA